MPAASFTALLPLALAAALPLAAKAQPTQHGADGPGRTLAEDRQPAAPAGKQLEHIPHEGAALLVANHVSFADAVVIMGAAPRPIRFVMDHHIFRTPLLGFIFRHCGAIPIASAKEEVIEETRDNLAQNEDEAAKLRAALARLSDAG